MPYYIRVLGSQDPDIHIDELISSLEQDSLTAKFELQPTEQSDKWTIIDIYNQDGQVLAQLERNPVIEGELGQKELDEFREIIQDFYPISAVQWLTDYFDRVKVIYALQLVTAAFEGANYDIIINIRTKVWNRTKGILQADNEGFSNETGYHILWQFFDNVTGEWSCAIKDSAGKWVNFVMGLGDLKQRIEFQNGEVPTNARRL